MAILDMNEELAQDVVKQIGGGKTKFFEANVLETESIEAAVKGVVTWSKETGKEIGGVIAAAGVSTPAKVSLCFQSHSKFLWRSCSLGLLAGSRQPVSRVWDNRIQSWKFRGCGPALMLSIFDWLCLA